MRFLHTGDWHVGKKLGRISREAEFEAVLDELVGIARDQKVDAVLVAGDLWDRALPPLDSMRLVIDALIRLADAGGTVVAIPGNHDSPQLFGVLARLLEPRGVILAPKIARPEDGGIVRIPSRDGTENACVAVFPFLHEAVVIDDVLKDSQDWFAKLDPGSVVGADRYADKVRRLSTALCSGFDPGGIGILMAHYFVDGAEIGGGERKIHLGEQYAATAQSIPPGAGYVALGHIHRPQEVVGAAVATRYCGSPLQLDFSERTHEKQAVIVDINAGSPAKVRTIALSSGRKLIRVTDELESLQNRAADFGDAYLDVRVKTSGPVFGLADQVRKFLPNAVMVQAVYERVAGSEEVAAKSLDGRITDLYAGYHLRAHGVEPPVELLDELRTLEEEVQRA
ncbi:MAG: exonuclease subunit SbcD, partial [Actinomycetota bacterium]